MWNLECANYTAEAWQNRPPGFLKVRIAGDKWHFADLVAYCSVRRTAWYEVGKGMLQVVAIAWSVDKGFGLSSQAL